MMVGRTVKEWVGRTPDSKVPREVMERVLERYDRTCWLSGRPIRPGDRWDCDHKVPLWLGGENRESNLAPALVEPHRAKTAAEAPVRAKVKRIRKKHAGIRKPSTFATSRDGPFKQRIGGKTERREP